MAPCSGRKPLCCASLPGATRDASSGTTVSCCQPRTDLAPESRARTFAGSAGRHGLETFVVERRSALRRLRNGAHLTMRIRAGDSRPCRGGDDSMPEDGLAVLPKSARGIPNPTRICSEEWLVTNGLGGYASGTVSGAITRRYHGLLIAASAESAGPHDDAQRALGAPAACRTAALFTPAPKNWRRVPPESTLPAAEFRLEAGLAGVAL